MLVLIGVASALVAPVIRGAPTADATQTVVVHARREAIRRAESLRLVMGTSGAWTLAVARSLEVIDSGRVRAASTPAGTWDFDALGGCLPSASETSAAPFDPLDCRAARGADRGFDRGATP